MTAGKTRSFGLARARAGAASLVALGAIAAIAAALVVGLIGTTRAVEAHDAVASVAAAGGERDRLLVRFEGDAGDTDARAGAIAAGLADLGLSGTLQTTDEGDGVFALRPDPGGFSADAVAALIAAAPDLAGAVGDHSAEPVQVSGGLRSTLSGLTPGLLARQGPTAVAIGVVGLLAVVVVAAAAVEPVRTRAAERALLRARGMAKRKLAAIAVAEALPVLALSTAIGALLGAAAVWVFSGARVPWPLALGAAGVLVAIGLLVVLVATLRGVDRRSQRADLAAGIGAVVLLTVLTALAVWQFALTGTPVVARGDGVLIDPLVALAPALVLALAALLAVVVSGPIAALAGAVTARGRGNLPVLPLRLASRRTGRHALTTGAVAFAAATIVLALAYVGSLAALGGTPEALRIGADVRVTSVPESADVAPLRELDGVEAAMSVRAITARGADGAIPILAVQSAVLGAVMHDADRRIDPAALGEEIGIGSPGVPLPDGADEITITVEVPQPEPWSDDEGNEWEVPPIGIVATLLIMDADGDLIRLPTTNVDPVVLEVEDGQYWDVEIQRMHSADFALPGTGPWALAGVEVIPDEMHGQDSTWVDVTVSAGGTPLDLSAFRSQGGQIEAAADGVRLLTIPPDWSRARLESTRALAPDLPVVFPAAITDALAASLDVRAGSTLSLRMASFSFSIDVRIAQVVPVLPGAPDGAGLLLDLTALTLATSEPIVANELWLAAEDASAVADAADAAVGGARVLVSDPRAAQSAMGTAVAFVLAAFGATALAVVVLVLRRSRGDGALRELGVLAVLGLGRRGAARVRAVENAFAVLLGVLGGVAAGAATAGLIVPPLARAAYVGMPTSFPIALDPVPLVLVPTLVVVAALFVAIAASVRVPRELAPVVREAE